MAVDLGDQRIALGGQAVDGLLGLPDQVDETGCVAAANLVTAGDPVRGGQQQAGGQTDHRDAEAPWGSIRLVHRSLSWTCSYVRLVRHPASSSHRVTPTVREGTHAQVQSP